MLLNVVSRCVLNIMLQIGGSFLRCWLGISIGKPEILTKMLPKTQIF